MVAPDFHPVKPHMMRVFLQSEISDPILNLIEGLEKIDLGNHWETFWKWDYWISYSAVNELNSLNWLSNGRVFFRCTWFSNLSVADAGWVELPSECDEVLSYCIDAATPRKWYIYEGTSSVKMNIHANCSTYTQKVVAWTNDMRASGFCTAVQVSSEMTVFLIKLNLTRLNNIFFKFIKMMNSIAKHFLSNGEKSACFLKIT